MVSPYEIYQWYVILSNPRQAQYGNTLMAPPLDNAPQDNSAAARFDVANRLFLRLYQASNLLHKTGTKAVSRYGATTQQWAVLGALARPAARDHGLTVKQLLEFLMVSRQNLTAVLDRLETAGLVERARIAGDGRLRHIRLTPRGAETWRAMQHDIRAYYETALAGFPIQDVVQLFQLLDRLKDGLARIADPD
jgi:MarR family transcriptional regulator, organic hydroperoxide resistance regulator